MSKAHALVLPDIPAASEENTPPWPCRLAVAGGSSRRPPDDSGPKGEVIPFPRHGGKASGRPERDADDQPLWPHWMAHVLTRYRPPEGGGQGPNGVFI